MTDGVVLYNTAAIEGTLQAIRTEHSNGLDLQQNIQSEYNHFDSIASGQATNAGMEFQQHGNSLRQDAADLMNMLHAAGADASQDMTEQDHNAVATVGL